MDVLSADLADRVANSSSADEAAADDLPIEVAPSEGPWVLVASASGLGKRVPVDQFRLQKRAGMGLRAIKFRFDGDVLVGLKVLGAGEQVLLVTEKGVIVRTEADAIPQSRRRPPACGCSDSIGATASWRWCWCPLPSEDGAGPL